MTIQPDIPISLDSLLRCIAIWRDRRPLPCNDVRWSALPLPHGSHVLEAEGFDFTGRPDPVTFYRNDAGGFVVADHPSHPSAITSTYVGGPLDALERYLHRASDRHKERLSPGVSGDYTARA